MGNVWGAECEPDENICEDHTDEATSDDNDYESLSENNQDSAETDDPDTGVFQYEITGNDVSVVPQEEKLKHNQVENNAGGWVWAVDDKIRLQRFLCLGSENGSFYTSEDELTRQNAASIDRMIAENRGEEVVETIKTLSVEGRCAKQNPAIFALAICARSKDEKTKRAAYEAMSDVCRIPTHLFQFIVYCEAESLGTGWGRAHRRAVCKWYNNYENDPMKLAMHVTKYKTRCGWAHADVLRLCHLKPHNNMIGFILRYITKGLLEARNMYMTPDASSDLEKINDYLQGIEDAKLCRDEDKMVELVRTHKLVREHVPTVFLKSPLVWKMLMEDMPISAMIRNLGKMSSIGLFDGDEEEKIVKDRLSNESVIRKSRLHPFSILLALHQYRKGRGQKGKLNWPVNKTILGALDQAFYMAFKNVEPTGKRFCLAIDVSGSMSMAILGSSMSCRSGAAAMMMSALRTEKKAEVVAFCHNLKELDIKPFAELSQVEDEISNMPFGATDCALPMVWAGEKRKCFDVFVVYTDCETWFGGIHPSEALVNYRRKMNIPDARLIVVAMTGDKFSIADPDDRYMMDMVGFDSSAPDVMNQFIMGNI